MAEGRKKIMRMTQEKTHYRKGDKSDYLMSWDIEGETKATIIKVVRKDADIRGKKSNVRLAYFKENFKPMVINVTNGRVIEKALGTYYIQDWHDISLPVILYVEENLKCHFADRGLRIRAVELTELKKGTKEYNSIVTYIRAGNDFTKVKEKYNVTDQMIDDITDEANNPA